MLEQCFADNPAHTFVVFVNRELTNGHFFDGRLYQKL